MKLCRIGIHKWSPWSATTMTYDRSAHEVMGLIACGYKPSLTITCNAQQRECLRCAKIQLRKIMA